MALLVRMQAGPSRCSTYGQGIHQNHVQLSSTVLAHAFGHTCTCSSHLSFHSNARPLGGSTSTVSRHHSPTVSHLLVACFLLNNAMHRTRERYQQQPTFVPAQQIKDNRQTNHARKSKKSHIQRLASSFTASDSNTACSGTSSSCSVSGRGPRRKPRPGRSCAYARQSEQVHSSRSLWMYAYTADRARRAMCSTANRAKTGGASHWP